MNIGLIDADGRHRVLELERMGVLPFAQPYRGFDEEQRAFARWVNIRPVHNSCTWEKYNDKGRSGQNGQ